MVKHAPEGWKEQYSMEVNDGTEEFEENCNVDSIMHKKSALSVAKKYSWGAKQVGQGLFRKFTNLIP